MAEVVGSHQEKVSPPRVPSITAIADALPPVPLLTKKRPPTRLGVIEGVEQLLQEASLQEANGRGDKYSQTQQMETTQTLLVPGKGEVWVEAEYLEERPGEPRWVKSMIKFAPAERGRGNHGVTLIGIDPVMHSVKVGDAIQPNIDQLTATAKVVAHLENTLLPQTQSLQAT